MVPASYRSLSQWFKSTHDNFSFTFIFCVRKQARLRYSGSSSSCKHRSDRWIIRTGMVSTYMHFCPYSEFNYFRVYLYSFIYVNRSCFAFLFFFFSASSLSLLSTERLFPDEELCLPHCTTAYYSVDHPITHRGQSYFLYWLLSYLAHIPHQIRPQ